LHNEETRTSPKKEHHERAVTSNYKTELTMMKQTRLKQAGKNTLGKGGWGGKEGRGNGGTYNTEKSLIIWCRKKGKNLGKKEMTALSMTGEVGVHTGYLVLQDSGK